MSRALGASRSGTSIGRQANGETSASSLTVSGSCEGSTSEPWTAPSTGPGPGRPKSQPWPSVAPSARAMARWASSSMPSASTTAPVRSACALTAFMISAIAGPGRSCTSRRSSLTTSGRSSGMNASDIASAPTSSTATPQPTERTRSTVRSSSAGRVASARSVISRTTRSPPGAARAMSSRSSSGARSSTYTGSSGLVALANQRTLRLYRVLDAPDAGSSLQQVQAATVPASAFSVDTVGLYRSPTSQKCYVFVGDGTGQYEQRELRVEPNGSVSVLGTNARVLDVQANSNAITADDNEAALYIGDVQGRL